jgi:hypothetical protein
LCQQQTREEHRLRRIIGTPAVKIVDQEELRLAA